MLNQKYKQTSNVRMSGLTPIPEPKTKSITNMGNNSTSTKKTIDKLLHRVLKIRGDKIITLCTESGMFTIDINQNNEFGYNPNHYPLFYAKLMTAIKNGGSMVIREFLTLSQKTNLPNGKQEWIPEKNLYGIALGKNQWVGLSAERLAEMHETDHKTGLPIPKEEGIHYQDFI